MPAGFTLSLNILILKTVEMIIQRNHRIYICATPASPDSPGFLACSSGGVREERGLCLEITTAAALAQAGDLILSSYIGLN